MLHNIKTKEKQYCNTEIFVMLQYSCYITKKYVIWHIPTFQVQFKLKPRLSC